MTKKEIESLRRQLQAKIMSYPEFEMITEKEESLAINIVVKYFYPSLEIDFETFSHLIEQMDSDNELNQKIIQICNYLIQRLSKNYGVPPGGICGSSISGAKQNTKGLLSGIKQGIKGFFKNKEKTQDQKQSQLEEKQPKIQKKPKP